MLKALAVTSILTNISLGIYLLYSTSTDGSHENMYDSDYQTATSVISPDSSNRPRKLFSEENYNTDFQTQILETLNKITLQQDALLAQQTSKTNGSPNDSNARENAFQKTTMDSQIFNDESRHIYTEVNNSVDNAIYRGHWDEQDRANLKKNWFKLSPKHRDDIMRTIYSAVNRQEIKLNSSIH